MVRNSQNCVNTNEVREPSISRKNKRKLQNLRHDDGIHQRMIVKGQEYDQSLNKEQRLCKCC